MPQSLPERRLRNRSVCCLYTTPPPYPGHYRQPLTTAGLVPPLISTNTDIAKIAAKFEYQKVSSEICNEPSPRKPPSSNSTGHRNFYSSHGRHRSAPRAVGASKKEEEIDDEEDSRSRISLHQSRARREFFFDQSNRRGDEADNTICGHPLINGKEANGDSAKASSDKPTSIMYHQTRTDESSSNKPSKDRRRKNVSKTSSGYNSLSSGESDAAEDVRNCTDGTSSADYSPQMSVVTPETPKSRDTMSSSSLSSFSSKSPLSPSQSDYVNNLRSTFTDEILKVLEEDGLIQPVTSPANGIDSPLPTGNMADRRSSSEYNVIELSKKYRKQEMNQRKAMEKVQSINDATQLQKMLDASKDEDQRQAIKHRLTDLKSKKDRDSTIPATTNGDQQQQRRSHSHLADVHRPKEKTPEAAGEKENKNSPERDGSPSTVGGIASLTQRSSPNGANGSPAAMNSQDAKPATTTTKVMARSASEIKSALLRWCQSKTKGYSHVNITNYSKSWCDGMAFCALIHHFYPEAFDYSTLDPKNRRENFELAFRVAEQSGDIPPLLEVDDVLSMGDSPDYKCIFTYVQQFYRRFHSVP